MTIQNIKTAAVNLLESATVTLSAGTAHADYPLYRLYDRDIGRLFKATEAETIEIKIDQGAAGDLIPDKLIIPKGHNLLGEHILVSMSPDNFTTTISLSNILQYSEALDNAIWVKEGDMTVTADVTTAPDGTMTADKISTTAGGTTNRIYQEIGLDTGQQYEPSFYLKKITSTGILRIYFSRYDPFKGSWSINLSLVGADWERMTREHAAVSIAYELIGFESPGGLLFFTPSAAPMEAYIWGCQLESIRNAPYSKSIEITDDDILIDLPVIPRRNLLKYSEDLGNAVWIKGGDMTVTVDVIIAPDGTKTADKIYTTAGGASNRIYQEIGLDTGQRYEPSFYLKKTTPTGTLQAHFSRYDSGYGRWEVDLSLIGSGWERITRDHAAVTIVSEFTGFVSPGGLLFYSLAGAMEAYIWGCQLVEGVVPLEYDLSQGISAENSPRYFKLSILTPTVVPQLAELFLSDAYEWEKNPAVPSGAVDDIFNVEHQMTAAGQDRFLVHGDAKRQRNYKVNKCEAAQKTNMLALNAVWAGAKPFWLCDHDGVWIYGILTSPINLTPQGEFPGGGYYSYDFNFQEVLP